MKMLQRIRHMMIKEFLQLLRDPRSRMIMLSFPIAELLLFGYAVTTDVKNIALAVYDQDNSVTSRELASRFLQSGYFVLAGHLASEAEMQAALDQGSARAVLHVNKGFSEDVGAGRMATIQMVVDGSISNTAGVVLSYSAQIVEVYSKELLEERWEKRLGAMPKAAHIELETRAWFNEELTSRNFFVPGVIAVIVLLVSLILTSMSVVREKEIGTMEQLLVTPIRPVEFILGKTIPFALVCFADVVLITLIAVFWFEVPVRGSLLLLLFATTLFLLSSLGMGLLISTVSATQQQAMMASFMIYLPLFLLSGFVFPIANMPQMVQWLTLLNPLRYYLVALRGVFLKGIGIDILWPQLAAMVLIGTVTLALSSRKLKKTLA